MKPPALDELRTYWAEAALHGDPEEFNDHFISNGWKVGRVPMKDWKAAARNWSRNEVKWGNGKAYPDQKAVADFNRIMAGLSMPAYRERFKERFGVEVREEKP